MSLLADFKEPLIAEEDIPCYKVLKHLNDDSYVSPFIRLKYTINNFNYPLVKYNEVCVNVTSGESPLFMIERGFLHCYTTLDIRRDSISFCQIRKLPYITSLYFFECYVPKGAKYFISTDKTEICSDELFVKNIKYDLKCVYTPKERFPL